MYNEPAEMKTIRCQLTDIMVNADLSEITTKEVCFKVAIILEGVQHRSSFLWFIVVVLKLIE